MRLFQIISQKFHRQAIAVKAIASEGLHTGHPGIGHLPESLPGTDVAEMHLHRRERHGLERVQNRDAGVGVSGGVYDDAVKYAVSSLDPVDDLPFVV